MPYVQAMQPNSSQQAVPLRPADAFRVFCTICEHTEFVHGDLEARRCLYSECGCSGFTLGAVALSPLARRSVHDLKGDQAALRELRRWTPSAS
jgi:hypothetical protein